MLQRNKHHSGYSILESILAIALLGLVVTSVMPTINFMLRRSRRSVVDTEASLLLQEAIEASYNIFLGNWLAFPPGRYKLALSDPLNPKWTLIPLAIGTEDILEAKYHRVIEIEEVKRNPGTGISGSGPVDPNSLQIVTTINWEQAGVAKTIQGNLLIINKAAIY